MLIVTFSYLLPFFSLHTLPSTLPPLLFSSLLIDAPKITNKMPEDCNIRLTSGVSQAITVEYNQGNPPAQVQWSKDGQPIDIPDPRITMDNHKTTLTLTNNDPSVRGTYGVKVSNGVGNGDTAVYIVEAECKLLCRVDLPMKIDFLMKR